MPAYYRAQAREFILADDHTILGALTHGFTQDRHQELAAEQVRAWQAQLHILRTALTKAQKTNRDAPGWSILLEYPIPRRGKRCDLVLIAGGALLVIEFKVGADHFEAADRRQVVGYCLDLRDFHEQSRGLIIAPMLIATNAPDGAETQQHKITPDLIQPVVKANANQFAEALLSVTSTPQLLNARIDAARWDDSRYFPTPTIIEAAQVLYEHHDVRDILHSHAAAKNLTDTKDAIERAIVDAQTDQKKIICFVTGVPGSGKTLAGLNVAHNPALKEHSLASFMSGNGPLIKVLIEALARDQCAREGTSKQDARQAVSAFIQNIHRYIKTYIDSKPHEDPPDRVIIFDEAQRAWDAVQNRKKWKRDASEPSLILSTLSRQPGWRVLVALIGSGQEIHDGEAGLPEWGRVLASERSDWEIRISSALAAGRRHAGNQPLFDDEPSHLRLVKDEGLHLDVALRAYKAHESSEWVATVLDGDAETAAQIMTRMDGYPVVLTRSLKIARRWLRTHAIGDRRAGLVASSGARRLRPCGIDVTCELPVEDWFLNPPEDVRSSAFLELAATEFAIQGLELDWIGVCWGADFRRGDKDWTYHAFKGTRWQVVRDEDKRRFVLNKYRVLLTRAREGMIIWVPPGDAEDQTRPPDFYDGTAAYLLKCGVREYASETAFETGKAAKSIRMS